MAWAAVGAAAGSLLSKFVEGSFNWGLANKSRNREVSAIRHLRRRAYQDQMFSMRQAGLNPMLASGASPGQGFASAAPVHSASGVDVASAVSSFKNADSQSRQAGVGERNVRISELKAPNEIATEYMRRFGIASEIERNSLQNDLTSATTQKTRADTELSLQESGSAAIRRLLDQKRAEKEGVSAQQIRLLNEQIAKGYNLTPNNVAGSGLRDLRENAKAEDARRENDPNYHRERDIPKYWNTAKERAAALGSSLYDFSGVGKSTPARPRTSPFGKRQGPSVRTAFASFPNNHNPTIQLTTNQNLPLISFSSPLRPTL